jgi:hypothetical protein
MIYPYMIICRYPADIIPLVDTNTDVSYTVDEHSVIQSVRLYDPLNTDKNSDMNSVLPKNGVRNFLSSAVQCYFNLGQPPVIDLNLKY